MCSQWPADAAARSRFASYLVNRDELGMNAMNVADLFALGLRSEVDEAAGLVTFTGTPIMCSVGLKAPPLLYSSQLVLVTLELLLSEYHSGFVTALAYSRLSGGATRAFWLDIYDRISWQSTPSMLFVVGLAIQRADIQAFLRMAHQRMALALRSNRRIDSALEVLCGLGDGVRAPWEVQTKTPFFETLSRIVAVGQIPLCPAGPAGDSDLLVNGTQRVRMAVRDRIFVATLLLYHSPGRLMGEDHVPWHESLPATAPAAFLASRLQFPELYRAPAAI